MKHIFYFIGILLLIYEFRYLFNIRKEIENTYRMLELKKEYEGNSNGLSNNPEFKNLALTKGIASLVFLVWMLCGLLTFNWPVFLGFLLIQLILISPLSKLVRYTVFYDILMLINTLLGIVFALFVIINSYHLKIDLQPFIIQLFG